MLTNALDHEEGEDGDNSNPRFSSLMRTFTKIPPSKLKAKSFPLKRQKGESQYLRHFELDPEILKKHLVQAENEDSKTMQTAGMEENEAVLNKNLLYSYIGDRQASTTDFMVEDELEEDKELENQLNNNVKFEN